MFFYKPVKIKKSFSQMIEVERTLEEIYIKPYGLSFWIDFPIGNHNRSIFINEIVIKANKNIAMVLK